MGGIAPVKQDRLLRQKPPVVVATPGRLWDLMRQGQQHLCDLSRLSFFVLDEADRMVQQVREENSSSTTNGSSSDRVKNSSRTKWGQQVKVLLVERSCFTQTVHY